MRIFDRQEWLRENRARARIKVFVDKYGIDELRRQTEEELKGDWVNERDFTLELFDHDEEANAPAAPMSYGSPNGDRSEFDRWVAANTRPQRQKGFSAVQVKVPATIEVDRGSGRLLIAHLPMVATPADVTSSAGGDEHVSHQLDQTVDRHRPRRQA